ncbi:GNAT family N-acetyltransferase [Nocardioides sp.]|uniref:GNAT family N-acetyltransferase n=1 Tax=Nocardioides sp. TaxID=35761 RepID=UPI0039E5E667
MAAPTDVSVRIAWTSDAGAIAALQLRVWRERYADMLAEGELPAPDRLAEEWSALLSRPKEARQRVLVALEHADVVGFVITGPADDPDAEPGRDGLVAELTVDPARTRRGHGSRLLQAAVDTLTADGFARGLAWAQADDDPLRALLAGAGWGPDGAHRSLRAESGAIVKEIRLHTALTD